MIKPYDYYDPFSDIADEESFPKIIKQDAFTRLVFINNNTYYLEVQCVKCREWFPEEDFPKKIDSCSSKQTQSYCVGCL